MDHNIKQQMNSIPTNGDGNTCQVSQEQARKEMKKEDERKEISKMMEKL
jgi:hypothetical protein